MKTILVLTATIAFVTAPLWSAGFNGFEANQFPIPQDDPPAQPAGYAFSIWGVIYLWLLISAVFGLVKRDVNPAWDATRWPMFLSLGVGASWLTVAQISPIWATVLIWVMLVTALIAMLNAPTSDPYLLRYPIQLYAGWLTAASAVSLALTGAGYGIGMGETGWAFLALFVAIGIAAMILMRGAAPFYALAVAWALVGVVVANLNGSSGVAILAAIGVALLGWLMWRGRAHAGPPNA